MMERIGTCTYIVGALLRGAFRRKLAVMKFEGGISDFIEAKGFLESQFSVKGTEKNINDLTRWMKAIAGESQ